ncbi:hypothetical protein LTR56_014471 [Elasticomyces elasticus]|nr:hypothetical protein LTR56_014471 [Elasticomyces elasticus]KAK3646529.1 hypothetical protein LTR22_014292 [Elasticomyces elasticus]KAK4910444.1 hypothetical protein LTR49_020879 [Elasticomyces elasticus]KAK5755660.1 hypothetical protein LTS12_014221 [Elasticomyces elasticus]
MAEAKVKPRFENMPVELFGLIFEYLPFKERVRACRISRTFVSAIRRNKLLWWHLDLRDAAKKVRTSFINRAVNIGRDSITKVSLKHVAELEMVLPILFCYGSVKTLLIESCGRQRSVVADVLTGTKKLKALHIDASGMKLGQYDIRRIMQTKRGFGLETLQCWLPGETTFTLRGIRNEVMTELIVSTKGSNSFHNFFEDITQAMPNLRRLTARMVDEILHARVRPVNLAGLAKLEHLELRIGMHSMMAFAFPSSLISLHLDTQARCEDAPIYHLPKLNNLWLKLRPMSKGKFAIPMFLGLGVDRPEDTKQLEVLGIANARLGPEGFRRLFTHDRLSSLQHLTLWRDRSEGHEIDAALLELSQNAWLPDLVAIDLSHTGVGADGLKCLTELPHLERIMVNNCPNIDKYAVHEARQGPGKKSVQAQDDETFAHRLTHAQKQTRCDTAPRKNAGK